MRKHYCHQDLSRIPVQANQSAKEHDSRPNKQPKLSSTDTIKCENIFDSSRNELKHKLIVSNGFATESSSRYSDLNVVDGLNSNNSNNKPDGDMLDTMKALLTCAVCLEVRTQTNQCANGHLICGQCSIRLIQQTQSKPATCPTCRIPLQYRLRRCLLAEQMAAEIPTQCHYCHEKYTRRSIRQHELESCSKRPVLCRFNLVGCEWKGSYSELYDHINLCTYKQLTVRDVESTLVNKIQRYESGILDGIQFCRSLLQKLNYNPTGMKIVTREIGVFRELDPNEDKTNTSSNCYLYQASNVNLSLSNLRRLNLEVRLDYKNNKLNYCFKTRSDRSVEFCLRLGLVRCGDLEINVDDQLHSVHFDSNRKETPVYVANLNLDYISDLKATSQDTFNHLNLRDGLNSLESELLSQTTDLVLDFIILTEQTEPFQFRFGNGSNQDYTQEFLDTSDTNSQPLNLRMRFERTDELEDTIAGIPSNTNSASETSSSGMSWRQLLTSPTGTLLRPFLGSLFPNSGRSTGNNNAPDVGNERPYSIVLTLTNLPSGETRDALIPTEHDEATSRSSTEDEEEDDDEEEDEEDDEDNASENESDSEAEVIFENTNANNNALDKELGLEKSETDVSRESDSLTPRLEENVKKPAEELRNVSNEAKSGLNTHHTKRVLATNVSNSSRKSVQFPFVLPTDTETENYSQTAGRRKRKNTRLNTNMNSCKSVSRPRSPARKATSDYSPRRKRLQRSPSSIEESEIPEQSPLGSSNPEDSPILDRKQEAPDMSECRMPNWLRGLVTAVSGLSRYMVRSHVVPLVKDTISSGNPISSQSATEDLPYTPDNEDLELKDKIDRPNIYEAEEIYHPKSPSSDCQLSSSESIDEIPTENPSLMEPEPETTTLYPIQTQLPHESVGLASHGIDLARQEMDVTEIQTMTSTAATKQSEDSVIYSDCTIQWTPRDNENNMQIDVNYLDQTIPDSNTSNNSLSRQKHWANYTIEGCKHAKKRLQ